MRFQKKQQEYNEEIYGLLLNEQTRMEEARTQERQRISEELHDGILGKLFATRLSLSLLGHKLLSHVPDKKDAYDGHIFEIQKIEKEIRSISQDLKNDLTKDHDTFLLLIQDLIVKTQGITKIQIHLEADGSIAWENLSNNHLINLYRILQEAIQNAIKHSHAENLTIEFIDNNKFLKLLITDDGLGFKRNNKKGIGLKNMRNRVNKLKGNLHIESSSAGVIISILIPISGLDYEK